MRQVDTENISRFCIRHSTAIIMIVAAILFFIRMHYALEMYPLRGDVVNFYNQAELVKAGMVPYADFVFEFPPYAMMFFLIPSMFTSDSEVYAQIFAVMVTIASLLCLYFLMKISDRMAINKLVTAFIFSALILMYYKDMILKFDAIPMLLTIMSIYSFQCRNRYLAYGLAAMGALVKMYPVFLIVIYLILDLSDRRDSRRVRISQGVFACVVVGLVAIIPLMVAGVSFGDIMSFLSFHTERGFQVESFMGVIIQALGLMGWTDVSLEMEHDTFDVISPVSSALLPYWNLFVTAIILVVCALIFKHAMQHGREGTSDRDLIVYSSVVFLIFILTNKVFSTQYMLWLFPLFAVLASFPGRRQEWHLITFLLVMEMLAVTMLMSYHPATVDFVIENLCRDLMMMALAVVLLLYICGRHRLFTRRYAGLGSQGLAESKQIN